MRFVGIVPEDAPDPAVALAERVNELPVPVLRLVPQPNLDSADSVSISTTDGTDGRSEMAVSLSYLLWRNPDDRSDPANFAELDEATKSALDTVPPWPRPMWLVEAAERMRYPSLWEAVRTTWLRDVSADRTLARELVDHTRYILMNRYPVPGAAGSRSWERARPNISQRAVDTGASMRINGTDVPAARIDTDPFVYAIGARLSEHSFLTAVLPRDELEYIRVEFDDRPIRSVE